MAKTKELKPVLAPEAPANRLRAEIIKILKLVFFDPLMAQLELTKNNAAPSKSKLLRMIRSGDLQYRNGQFYGKVNAGVSKELRELGATFSKTDKRWRLSPEKLTTELKRAVEAQRVERERLERTFRQGLSRIQTSAQEMLATVGFESFAESTEEEINKRVRVTLADALAVQPTLDADAQREMRKAYTDNVRLSIVGFIDDEVKRFRKNILPEIQAGIGREALTEYVQARLKVGYSRAKFIARQENALFTSKQKELQYRDAGIDRYRWKAIGGRSGDGRTRDEHRQAHGKIFYWSKDVGPNGARKPIDTDGVAKNPGESYNCFVGDTSISLIGEIVRSYKRFYEGSIVSFECGGKRIRVTPNHPILTTKGWVFAKELNNDCQLLQSIGSDLLNGASAEVNDVYPTASQIHDFLRVQFPFERVAGIDIQFHGDGTNHKVDVITIDSKLRNKANFLLIEKFGNNVFSDSLVSQALLTTDSDFATLLKGVLYPTGGRVSCPSLLGSGFGVHAFPLELFRLGLVPKLNASIKQISGNDMPSDVVFFREFVETYTRQVEALNLIENFRAEIFSIVGSLSLFKAESLTEIKHEFYSGYVYNFETTRNMYIANQVVASNCRCQAVPIVETI